MDAEKLMEHRLFAGWRQCKDASIQFGAAIQVSLVNKAVSWPEVFILNTTPS